MRLRNEGQTRTNLKTAFVKFPPTMLILNKPSTSYFV